MEETIPKQAFHLQDLSTKCVTLYPSRAYVIREVNNISLSPGQSEIEIYGLGPMVEENSVQIEGTGQATITDITVDLVPNKDDFFDLYPEDDDFSEDDMSEPENSDSEIVTVKSLSALIKKLDENILAEEDLFKSAQRQLDNLEFYLNSVHNKETAVEPQNIASCLKSYQEERDRLFKLKTKSFKAAEDMQKEKTKIVFKKSKADKEERKRKERLAREKEKAKAKKERQRQEKRKEAARVKEERQKFWPNKVYKVVVRLETSIDTPGSSRRNSIDSITLAKATPESLEKVVPKGGSPMDISLTISYITDSLFWTPRYDLNISSLNKTATIVYRAELSNGTSETFKDAKVTLSTSQTSFTGLDDKPPTMNAWHVTLHKSYAPNVDALVNASASMPISEQVRQTKAKSKRAANMGWQNKSSVAPQRSTPFEQSQQTAGGPVAFSNTAHFASNSGGLFGSSSTVPVASNATGGLFGAPPPAPMGAMQQVPQVPQVQATMQQHMAAVVERGEALDTLSSRASNLALSSSFFGKKESRARQGGGGGNRREEESTSDLGAMLAESEGGPGGLDFEESTWEDDGLTASYDLPGTRTLVPSSVARRHKVATLQATNVQLNHITIPKLRTAAFLRAKIKNPSGSVTLLKGMAGVTLDGSFLGSIPMPRVSPYQLFTIPLGVDPAIHINYPKPTLHRSTQGIFSKEGAHVCSRSIYITNTKPMPVEIIALDQVPVSQEERLRIEILQPRGLTKEGDNVKTGVPLTEGKGPWGKAVATLKKGGEICWVANIEKSQACILKFDYEARLPSSESVLTVD
jgi:Domain of unknown function (DUF4139)/N-terminal domain of unknown function (DUF4140)